jgi:large subunit ribosomal protein L25
MDKLELNVQPRQVTGKKVKRLRNQGIIPAVIYGRNEEPQLIQIENKALTGILKEAGTHKLVSLKINGQKPRMTLARDIQRDVIKHNYLHVDFYSVHMDEKTHANVPVVLVGESPAVKNDGGVLTSGLNDIDLECLPGDIPESVIVNLDGLVNFNDTLSVKDLRLPDTITILSDPDSMIVKIEPPRAAVVEEEAVDGSVEPEVISQEDKE